MAKVNKEELARIGGMQYALKIAKEAKDKGDDPVQALEKEVQFRCKYNVPISIPQSAMNEFCEKVKENMFRTMKIVAEMSLRDAFDFSTVRLKRFWDKFDSYCECIFKDYVTFEDMAAQLKEECGIENDPYKKNIKVRI